MISTAAPGKLFLDGQVSDVVAAFQWDIDDPEAVSLRVDGNGGRIQLQCAFAMSLLADGLLSREPVGEGAVRVYAKPGTVTLVLGTKQGRVYVLVDRPQVDWLVDEASRLLPDDDRAELSMLDLEAVLEQILGGEES